MSPLPTSHRRRGHRPAVGVLQHHDARRGCRSGPARSARWRPRSATTGAILGAIDLVRVERGTKVRDITVACVDAAHGERVVDAVAAIAGRHGGQRLDRTFLMHQGGKIEVNGEVPVKTRDDLSMAYTPGVARVCMAIHDDPERAWSLTIKGNTVAVVSDGTAVLGLGDIGPEAAMPVMEGKALLFKEFAGVDAFPICLATKDVDEIVAHREGGGADLRRHQPRGHRGPALLRDRAAPAGGARHPRLPRRPARHGDRRRWPRCSTRCGSSASAPEDVRVVVTGAGAAGMACANILLPQGVAARSSCATSRARCTRPPGHRRRARAVRRAHEPAGRRGHGRRAARGADVFIGLSGPGAVSPDEVRTMAPGAIVFAMANPTPEVQPEEVGRRRAR